MKRFLKLFSLTLVLILVGLAILIKLTTLQPDDVEAAPVACDSAPTLQPGQELTVMSWNVQYMAGKNHIFFYDPPTGDGPDERPTRAEIEATYAEVVRVIADERPEVILLQEVDQGADRTDDEDQTARLLGMLPAEYRCFSETFYWQAAYLPHPRINGSVGMKLVTISRVQLSSATRHQLAIIPEDPLSQQFNLKRAVLEVRVPIAGGGEVALMNTHLDAFAQGTDTMQRQVDEVAGLLAQRTAENTPWLFGGDFNLLPDRAAYDRLLESERAFYNPETEIVTLRERFPAVPSQADTSGPDAARWYTHFPNHATIDGPDRTIDYIFYSPQLELIGSSVRSTDTLAISDHLPLLIRVRLPE